jgi:hypothetical protein
MSNFLNNLAARALRRQETVRPRIASLFEPPTGPSSTLPAGPSDVETTLFERMSDAPSTIRPNAPQAVPHLDSNPPVHESAAHPPTPVSPRHDAPAGEAGRTGGGLRPVAPAAPLWGESAGEGRPHFTSAEPGGEAPPSTGRQAEMPQQVEVVRRDGRVAGAPEVAARETEAFAGTEEKVRELEGRVASLEASRTDEGGGNETSRPAPGSAVPVTTRPAATPYTPASAAPPAPVRGVERGDEPPHVNVTIGRVEVRAVFPAPAEAPRQPASRRGPTPLAEYLSQREGGRR